MPDSDFTCAFYGFPDLWGREKSSRKKRGKKKGSLRNSGKKKKQGTKSTQGFNPLLTCHFFPKVETIVLAHERCNQGKEKGEAVYSPRRGDTDELLTILSALQPFTALGSRYTVEEKMGGGKKKKGI